MKRRHLALGRAMHPVAMILDAYTPTVIAHMATSFADRVQLLGQQRQDFDLVDGHGLLLASIRIFHKASSVCSLNEAVSDVVQKQMSSRSSFSFPHLYTQSSCVCCILSSNCPGQGALNPRSEIVIHRILVQKAPHLPKVFGGLSMAAHFSSAKTKPKVLNIVFIS